MRLEGIVVPVITPYVEGRIDQDSTVKLVEYLLHARVHGLFVASTTGEGLFLDDVERRELMRIVKRIAKGKVPILFSVAAVSTAESCRLSDLGEEEGADAVVITPPYYYRFTQEEILAHLSSVTNHGDLPVVLYNIPQRTGNQLDIKTIAALMKDHRVVCIKDSSGDIAYLQKVLSVVRPDVSVLVGDDALILPAIIAGAHGAVSGLANIIPNLMVDLYQAAQQGNIASARALQQQVIKAQSAILTESSMVAALKAASAIRGLPVGDPITPSAPLAEEARQRLAQSLKLAGVFSV